MGTCREARSEQEPEPTDLSHTRCARCCGSGCGLEGWVVAHVVSGGQREHWTGNRGVCTIVVRAGHVDDILAVPPCLDGDERSSGQSVNACQLSAIAHASCHPASTAQEVPRVGDSLRAPMRISLVVGSPSTDRRPSDHVRCLMVIHHQTD
ncbi:hypothetical protein BD309DRAFT_710709 [Dichomitus squalens]|uniref:Uncharacterized protein n=1 Tax=Dichomitus squalens TaxID=114155 RepID=A0A4Q9MRY9_9APHY|nr:hypothetical protein BD311DRAFT_249725 [Dichomitus squalens]TBU45531.1 hypothetical protein BD309DRAFT_710709 [Dichomitus squalens]